MERRENTFSLVVFLFFIPFLIWVLLQFFGPIFIPSNSIEDLSGIVGVSDNTDITTNLSFPLSFLYNSGDILCHQKAQRSFFINGNQMPFCSRCTSIWLGLSIGLAIMIFYRIELDNKFLFLILIGFFPIAIDGFGQLLQLWESTNVIRTVTGLLAGVVTGVAIGVIIDELGDLKKEKKVESQDFY